ARVYRTLVQSGTVAPKSLI
ncbi:hypothetical protein A2U01_0096398, partial [Trifolium medium]|nr:hypothetical protein [Trifolium medium]